MRTIRIKEPKWSTREVLVRSWSLDELNKIVIIGVKNLDGTIRYQPKIMAKTQLVAYPTLAIKDRDGITRKRYRVPLDEFEKTQQTIPTQNSLFEIGK